MAAAFHMPHSAKLCLRNCCDTPRDSPQKKKSEFTGENCQPHDARQIFFWIFFWIFLEKLNFQKFQRKNWHSGLCINNQLRVDISGDGLQPSPANWLLILPVGALRTWKPSGPIVAGINSVGSPRSRHRRLVLASFNCQARLYRPINRYG